MASVRKHSVTGHDLLEYALGKRKVSLSDLTRSEFIDLLRTILEELDLRKLRGFQPIRQLLCFRPGSVVYGVPIPTQSMDIEIMVLAENVQFEAEGFSENEIVDLDTHAQKTCRGWWGDKRFYKRNETDEITDDLGEARSWGRSAYLSHGNAVVWGLKRPRNHTSGDENLITIEFHYRKIPFKNQYEIFKLKVENLPLNKFHEVFAGCHLNAAIQLIWEIAATCRITADGLSSQLQAARQKADELTRLSESITSG